MTAHAVLTLHGPDGRTHRYTGDGAPEFTVPAIADFYTWACATGTDLSADTYQQYAGSRDALPHTPFTDRTILTPVRARELAFDYLYDLAFAHDGHGLRLEVHDRSLWTITQKSTPLHSLTHADLYEAAAVWCDQLSSRAEQYASAHEGLTLPGGDPDLWADRANAYRQRHQDTPSVAARANLAATFHRPAFDVAYPAVQVGGVMVFVYVTPQGRLRVSVDLDETEAWLQDPKQDQVLLDITINGHHMF